MPAEQIFSNRSIQELELTAKEIVDFAGDSKIWLFLGDMGAGKTTTIKAICKALGVMDEVQSPTFSIVNEYLAPSDQVIYHFDFYRIDDVEEVHNIGIEEYFYSGNVCLIEWPEKIESILPEEFLRVDISENPDQTRNLKLSMHG